MQILAKHTQALHIEWNTQQFNVIIQSKKLLTYS